MRIMPEKSPCVYILTSKPYGTLYVGVTSNLIRRVWLHQNSATNGFTCKYKVHILVWYELHDRMDTAIAREKSLKRWRRLWKIRLIEQDNPNWLDLHSRL
jgi:putative endonuclease